MWGVERRRFVLVWIAALTLTGSLSQIEASKASASHPFHTSIAEVDWNGQTGSFEVALSLWPLDVEELLRERLAGQGETVGFDLDDPSRREEIDGHLRDYVLSKFRLTVMPAVTEGQEEGSAGNREPSKYEWLGSEFEKDAIWVYFRVIPSAEVTARLPQEAPEGPTGRERRAQEESQTQEENREPLKEDEANHEQADGRERAAGRGVLRLRLRDEVLIEIQPEQRNTITLRIAGRRETFEFNSERGSRAVNWPITWER